MWPLQKQTSLRCGHFLDTRKHQRSYPLKYYFYLLLHSSLTYNEDRRVLRCHWFMLSFYKVECFVRHSYWKGSMPWVYVAWICLSPLSGISPSLIDTNIWGMYSIQEVFFPQRTVPLTSAEKNLNLLKVTKMYQHALFCSISWYMVLLSTFYIWRLIITANFLW